MIKFLNCKIDLSKKVFQPRIETEFWVGKAIEEIKLTTNNQQPTTKILDLFAGTGCIGIAILKNIENSKLDFVDFSEEAIEQIKINLRINKIQKEKYRIYKSDLFKEIKNKRYDVIFANPPYVALDRIQEVRKEVLKKEPKEALFAGRNGIFWIEKFLKEVKNYFKKGGIFYMEFDPLQKEKIKEILEKENFKFNFYKDQFQKFRWLKVMY